MKHSILCLCLLAFSFGCEDSVDILVDVDRDGVDVDQVIVWTGDIENVQSRARTGPSFLPEVARAFAESERFSLRFPTEIDGATIVLVVDFLNGGVVVGSASREFVAGQDARVSVRLGEIERCGDGELRAVVEECDSNAANCVDCRLVRLDGGVLDDGGAPVDGGKHDAGPRDGGPRDGGPRDGGRDGGEDGGRDGGGEDAGASDAGIVDAGPFLPLIPEDGQSAIFAFDDGLIELLSETTPVLDPVDADALFVDGIDGSAAGIEEGAAKFVLQDILAAANGDCTIIMWLRDDTPLTDGPILSIRPRLQTGARLSSRGGDLVFANSTFEARAPVWNASVAGGFHHIALVISDDSPSIFVDGKQFADDVTISLLDVIVQESIGFHSPLGTSRFFDLVEVYPRVLSPTAIQLRWIATLPRVPAAPVSDFPFDGDLVNAAGGVQAASNATDFVIGPRNQGLWLVPTTAVTLPAVTADGDQMSASFWFRDDANLAGATLAHVPAGITIKVDDVENDRQLVIERPGGSFAGMRLANYLDEIPRGHWHHALISLDRDRPTSERVQVFVDGRVLPFDRTGGFSNASSAAMTTTPWKFGFPLAGWAGAVDSARLYDRALTHADAIALSLENAPVFPTAPAVFWPFDGMLLDAVSGKELTSSTLPSFEAGVSASAVRVTEKAFLTSADTVPLGGLAGFTLATYVRLNSPPYGDHTLLGVFEGNDQTDVRLGVGIDRLFLDVSGDDGVDRYIETTSGSLLEQGTWHLVVARFDGAAPPGQRGAIFVDGVAHSAVGPALPEAVLDAPGAWTFSIPISIGPQLDVSFDETAFFDRALSDTEIFALRPVAN